MLHSFLLLALFTERATATTALRAVKTDEELPASTLLVGKRMHPGDADANVITHQCETFHDWRACTETIEGCGWCVTTEGLGKVSCVERQSVCVCVCVERVCACARKRERAKWRARWTPALEQRALSPLHRTHERRTPYNSSSTHPSSSLLCLQCLPGSEAGPRDEHGRCGNWAWSTKWAMERLHRDANRYIQVIISMSV